MMRKPTTIAAAIWAIGALALGGGSLVLLAAFLYLGPFELLPLGLPPSAALAFDALLSLAFFVQHSGMVRPGFRRRLASSVHEDVQPAFYSVASGITLFIVLVFWQRTGIVIATLDGAARLATRAVFLMAVAGFGAAGGALRSFDPFGVHPLIARLRGTAPPPIPLTIRGPYRWVRHPLYSLSIVLIWAAPDLTLDRLLFNVLWTIWIVVGARLEERDLVTTFGDAYRDYQKGVPMLLPLPRRTHRG